MKKMYRNERDGMLAGICAGLGEMFKIDPVIVRLVAVFLTVITSFLPMIAAYIVGWFIIPEKAELQMKNEL